MCFCKVLRAHAIRSVHTWLCVNIHTTARPPPLNELSTNQGKFHLARIHKIAPRHRHSADSVHLVRLPRQRARMLNGTLQHCRAWSRYCASLAACAYLQAAVSTAKSVAALGPQIKRTEIDSCVYSEAA